MQFKLPKSDKYQWTQHAQWKMRQYGLSPQRVIRVIRNPERTEEGIVEKTIACMQRASTNKKSGEIWCMYQIKNHKNTNNTKHKQKTKSENTNSKAELLMKLKANEAKKLKIISAWRYPGVSPKNNPIPEEILNEIEDLA